MKALEESLKSSTGLELLTGMWHGELEHPVCKEFKLMCFQAQFKENG